MHLNFIWAALSLMVNNSTLAQIDAVGPSTSTTEKENARPRPPQPPAPAVELTLTISPL
jgi:hypothetical protein